MSDEDYAVAVCSECGTEVSDQQATKNKFLQSGLAASCKLCGGVMIVTMKSQLKKALNNSNRNRGI